MARTHLAVELADRHDPADRPEPGHRAWRAALPRAPPSGWSRLLSALRLSVHGRPAWRHLPGPAESFPVSLHSPRDLLRRLPGGAAASSLSAGATFTPAVATQLQPGRSCGRGRRRRGAAPRSGMGGGAGTREGGPKTEEEGSGTGGRYAAAAAFEPCGGRAGRALPRPRRSGVHGAGGGAGRGTGAGRPLLAAERTPAQVRPGCGTCRATLGSLSGEAGQGECRREREVTEGEGEEEGGDREIKASTAESFHTFSSGLYVAAFKILVIKIQFCHGML